MLLVERWRPIHLSWLVEVAEDHWHSPCQGPSRYSRLVTDVPRHPSTPNSNRKWHRSHVSEAEICRHSVNSWSCESIVVAAVAATGDGVAVTCRGDAEKLVWHLLKMAPQADDWLTSLLAVGAASTLPSTASAADGVAARSTPVSQLVFHRRRLPTSPPTALMGSAAWGSVGWR